MNNGSQYYSQCRNNLLVNMLSILIGNGTPLHAIQIKYLNSRVNIGTHLVCVCQLASGCVSHIVHSIDI